MELQMQITMVLALVNIVLLLAIMSTEASSYRRMRAEYTLFIIIFTGMFLLQYFVGAYLYFMNMEVYHPSVAWHMLILTGLQTGAFAYMLWMLQQ